jgi:hypothetical protein
MEHKVFLSKRNIQTLLNKLDRNKHGDGGSACTLIKCDNLHAKYPQTMTECAVTAVEKPEDVYESGGKYTSGQIYLDREVLNRLLTPGETILCGLTDGKVLCDDTLLVMSLEDNEYYSTRAPGEVHHLDDPGMKR